MKTNKHAFLTNLVTNETWFTTNPTTLPSALPIDQTSISEVRSKAEDYNWLTPYNPDGSARRGEVVNRLYTPCVQCGEFVVSEYSRSIIDKINTVIYSLKENESGRFVLTTIVKFNDGSKSVVRNSELDPIKEVKKTAHGFPYATEEAKEIGLIYAIIKYVISNKRKEDGTVEGDGYVRKLSNLIKSARDDSFIAEEKVSDKEERAKKHQERIAHDKEVAENRKKRISEELIETTIELIKKHLKSE